MLMFFDYFFKSCMMLPYLEFMKNSGFSVRFFRLQFYSTRMNRSIVKWSSKFPNFYRQSFKLGCYMSMLMLPLSLALVISSIFDGGSQESTVAASASGDVARLEILLPGVNLPLNQIGFYVVALLICSVVHEAGHGIAAVLEDVPVIGFGLTLIFIIPIAYTEIDMDHLQTAKLMKKLKIYTAGIWNNIILAAVCYILLLLVPLFLAPIYETGEGVFITKIQPKAAVKGENGLYVGDKVTHVNGCPVKNEAEWLECLKDSIAHHPAYCVTEEFIHANEESAHDVEHKKDGSVSCCPENPALNCFDNADEERLPQYVCLNIRNTVEHAKNYCHKSRCPQHSSCLKPILANHSTIIHMKRKNRTKELVYYGHPYDVLRNVVISEFTPKTKVFEPWFADNIVLLLKYLAVFSSGLAMVNVLPCFGLDGQYLVSALVGNLPNQSKSRKELFSNTINVIGSVTLLVATIKIIYRTFV